MCLVLGLLGGAIWNEGFFLFFFLFQILHMYYSCSQKEMLLKIQFFSFFQRFIYFLERGREGEREGEKHQCVVASQVPPIGDLACNPGMCPRLGIEPATLWFAGQHSIHWPTPAWAKNTNIFIEMRQLPPKTLAGQPQCGRVERESTGESVCAVPAHLNCEVWGSDFSNHEELSQTKGSPPFPWREKSTNPCFYSVLQELSKRLWTIGEPFTATMTVGLRINAWAKKSHWEPSLDL